MVALIKATVCPFGLIRILLELDKAIENELEYTQNGWMLDMEEEY